jgi:enamine deaminase RidA (YjgF/YER057c/UK114 family)
MLDRNKRNGGSATVLLPEGWPKPKGYANGIRARGEMIFIAGQIGWDTQGRFADGFVAQTRQALQNVMAVLAEGGGQPEHLVRMTWYVTDIEAYRRSLKELGATYREVVGRHYPAMTLLGVRALAEPEASIEIEATAVLPD